jgi:amino acid permease
MVNAFEEEEEMLFNELEFPVNQFDQNSLFEFDETVPKIHLSQTIQQKEVQMEKTVNLWAGWSVIVGAIIGSGIFASPGPVIQYSGSTGASLIVWIIGGLLAMTGGLCYAELGTMIPESGGGTKKLT